MACEVCQKVYVPAEDIFMDSDVKPHLCNTCGKSFSLKIQLKRHILTHADNAPYTCYSCEKNSSNQSKTYNLRLTKKGNYVCEKCNSSFNTRRLLLRHSKEHDVPEMFTCEECDELFDTELALKKHSSVHRAKRPYRRHSIKLDAAESSSVCDEQGPSEKFSCEDCDEQFDTELTLKKHSSIHRAKRPYKRHSTKLDVAESLSVCDEIDPSKKLGCEDCNEQFDTELALKKHSSIHKVKRPYRKQSVKVEAAESSFVCGDCGKSFIDVKSFEKHSLSHKRHPCAHCPKTFSTIAALERHKKGKCKFISPAAEKDQVTIKSENEIEDNDAASSDKKHVCGICGKSFSRKSSLEGHVIVHLTEEENGSEIDDEYHDNDYVQEDIKEKKFDIDLEPPRLPKLKIRTKFRCDTCNEIFTTDEALKEHEPIHKNGASIKVGEIPVVKEFLPPEEIPSRKVKKEPEEKKYNCSICSESFISRKKLDSHNLDIHNIQKVKKKSTSYRFVENSHFLCEICDKVFSRKSRLKKHLLFHENKLDEDVSSDDMESFKKPKSKEKRFPCETCGKRFAGKVCLEKHILRHFEPKDDNASAASNGETPTPKRRKNVKELICEFCKEDFTGRKNAFIKHRNLHTPEVCGICDERFVDRQALREHCKSHIGTEEARVFLECSQKAFNAKNGIVPPEPKVEYIYLVLR